MNTNQLLISRVSEQLSETTQKIRGRLLIASSTGIVIFHTGLIPNQIEGFGVVFNEAQQRAMLICLLALISFLFLSFIISATADISIAQLKRRAEIEETLLFKINDYVERYKKDSNDAKNWMTIKSIVAEMSKKLEVSQKSIKIISISRFIWEIVIPVTISTYSVTVLVIYLLAK